VVGDILLDALEIEQFASRIYRGNLCCVYQMKLSVMDGSPPREEDTRNGLVTLTVTSYLVSGSDPVIHKLDRPVTQSGIIPFTLSLPNKDSTSASLSVLNTVCLSGLCDVYNFT